MTTLVVYGDTADGYLVSYADDWEGETYSDAMAGTGTGGIVINTGTAISVGDLYGDGIIEIREGFLAFDTSSIGSGDTVSAAVARLTASSGYNSPTIRARSYDWGTSLTTADWRTSPTSYTLRASYATSGGWTAGTGYDMTDTAMAAGVVKAGVTRLLMTTAELEAGGSWSSVTFYSADQTGTTYDPKLTVEYTTGGGSAQDITLGLLDAGSALYAPTVIKARYDALFPPTLTLAPYPITLALLDSGPALYAPTVANAGGGTQTVSLGLLDAGAQTYELAFIRGVNTLSLGLLDNGAALYAPSVTSRVTISLGLLTATNALYAPALATRNTLTLGLLDGGAALYQPTLTPKSAVVLPFLGDEPALYAPSLTLAPYPISLDLLDGGAVLYDPVVQAVGSYQSIDLGFLDSGSALYDPTLILDQFIVLPYLGDGALLFEPEIQPDQFVTLGLLDSGRDLYAVSVVGINALVIPMTDGAAALYAPTLAYAPYPITVPLLDEGRALYDPAVRLAPYPITLGLLTSTSAVYSPTIRPYSTLTLDQIDGGRALYALQVIAPFTVQQVSVGFINLMPELYAPEFTNLSESELLARKYAALLFAEERRRQFRGTPHPHRRW